MKPLTKPSNKGFQLQNLVQETILNIQNLIDKQANQEDYETLVEAAFKTLAEVDCAANTVKNQFITPFMKQLNELDEALPQVTFRTKNNKEVSRFVAIKLFLDKKEELGLNSTINNDAWNKFKASIISPVIDPRTQEKPQTTTPKPNKNTARPASKITKITIDFTKYIELAIELLNGDTWEKIAIGLAMATFRRDCEIGLDMNFQEDEHDYAIIISSPAKKEDRDKFHRVPTLVRGSLIIDAVEKLRSLLPESKTHITRELEGRKAGNKAWNNSENKRVATVYDEFIRPFLKGGEKHNKHQLRNIGTSFIIQLQRNIKGSFVGDDKDYLEFARRALAHEFEDTTRGYATWNIKNIPEYLNEILDYPIGEIEPTEAIEVIEENKGVNTMALLEQILANISDNPEAFELAQKAFTAEDGTIKKGNDLALALGRIFKQAVGNTIEDGITIKTAENPKSADTWSKLHKVIKTLMEYNQHTEKDFRIEIAPSPIRSFYEVMFEKTVNINDVHNFLAANQTLNDKIKEHNEERELLAGHNLKWRKKKETVVTNFKTYIK